MQYKTVAAPKGLEIKAGEKGGVEKAIAAYSELISKEAVGGWEFHSIETITIYEKLGCFASLFKSNGINNIATNYNMLIFKKED
jgi:hypothetical protein